jgi:hypothetical protein
MFAMDPVGRTRVGAGPVSPRPHTAGCKRSILVLALVAGTLGLASHDARAGYVSVNGTSNIFGAGHAVAPDPGSYGPGTLPPAIDLFAAPGRTLTFDMVAGQVSCLTSMGWYNGPDGGTYATGDTDILSFNGISGITHATRTMFLVGVFTDGTVPEGAAPSRQNASSASSALSWSPQLFQTFFIGDGLTGEGTGSVQVFHVPDGATKLYLGFADAYGFGDPIGLPGSYNDNSGSVDVFYKMVPAPSTFAFAAGGASLLLARRRR